MLSELIGAERRRLLPLHGGAATDFTKPRSSGGTPDTTLTVAVRKRPLSNNKHAASELDVIAATDTRSLVVLAPGVHYNGTPFVATQQFAFDAVFSEAASNASVYDALLRPHVLRLHVGANLTAFAYGQTGSGKTFTMNALVDSALDDVFSIMNTAAFASRKLTLCVSYFELYCGAVFDLLAADGTAPLALREDAAANVHVVGLTEHSTRDLDVARALVQRGAAARHVGSTRVNVDSSRSHCVLQLALREAAATNAPSFRLLGRLSLIDLAGSEHASKAAPTSRVAHHEAAEINRSLLALKECIRALHQSRVFAAKCAAAAAATHSNVNNPSSKSQPLPHVHIPFRGTTITRLLKDCFTSPDASVVMIATVSPGSSSAEHGLNTLRYASRLKESRGATASANARPANTTATVATAPVALRSGDAGFAAPAIATIDATGRNGLKGNSDTSDVSEINSSGNSGSGSVPVSVFSDSSGSSEGVSTSGMHAELPATTPLTASAAVQQQRHFVENIVGVRTGVLWSNDSTEVWPAPLPLGRVNQQQKRQVSAAARSSSSESTLARSRGDGVTTRDLGATSSSGITRFSRVNSGGGSALTDSPPLIASAPIRRPTTAPASRVQLRAASPSQLRARNTSSVSSSSSSSNRRDRDLAPNQRRLQPASSKKEEAVIFITPRTAALATVSTASSSASSMSERDTNQQQPILQQSQQQQQQHLQAVHLDPLLQDNFAKQPQQQQCQPPQLQLQHQPQPHHHHVRSHAPVHLHLQREPTASTAAIELPHGRAATAIIDSGSVTAELESPAERVAPHLRPATAAATAESYSGTAEVLVPHVHTPRRVPQQQLDPLLSLERQLEKQLEQQHMQQQPPIVVQQQQQPLSLPQSLPLQQQRTPTKSQPMIDRVIAALVGTTTPPFKDGARSPRISPQVEVRSPPLSTQVEVGKGDAQPNDVPTDATVVPTIGSGSSGSASRRIAPVGLSGGTTSGSPRWLDEIDLREFVVSGRTSNAVHSSNPTAAVADALPPRRLFNSVGRAGSTTPLVSITTSSTSSLLQRLPPSELLPGPVHGVQRQHQQLRATTAQRARNSGDGADALGSSDTAISRTDAAIKQFDAAVSRSKMST